MIKKSLRVLIFFLITMVIYAYFYKPEPENYGKDGWIMFLIIGVVLVWLGIEWFRKRNRNNE
ncbi:hypothetical protein [Halalkalibacter akibai]|uniref:LPXTG cell wall anchor domain-containing protein n=1 Tax=Halalkalibacter akibai (strain ATCC 43226 / DSM 21942 / CIP 109018 / JCM 9157 / 1139) TaxID=1236973 RepID=W4QXX3_HALA3|nr:hypothetical protein [Halalkalibacter akibai]GAE36493.1 hypothetical protein JCM9157_3684 [Halalkalibacter akibai JCM 9157]